MAHHVLGIDLGAHSVKVIVLSPGFRSAAAVDFIERPVPAGEEPLEIRGARVLGDIVRERKLDGDSAYAAVAGDKLFIHVLELPFRGLRRVELEKAVGAELEGILPIDLEDMVFGFEGLPADSVAPAPAPAPGAREVGDDEPTNVQRGIPVPAGVVHGRVAAPTTGMRILACAMETERARSLLETLRERAVEPRGLVAAPASYARVLERIPRLGGAGVPVAIVDIGHLRTDICVVKDGKAAYARTLMRGGHHLTETISRTWRISYEQAEQAKHADGFIASAAEPATSTQWQRIHDAVVTEIGPLAADLKRTLASCRAKTGVSVAQVLLVGGGSRLRGLASYFGERLHVPVTTLSAEDADSMLGPGLSGVPVEVALLAAGVAFEGATGRPHFDLRQGELAYKADLSFLRQKATAIATALLVIIGFAVANGYAALYELRADERALAQRVALESAEAFGTQLSASDVLGRAQGQIGSKKSPLPKMTAYDVLLELSNRLPPRDKVKLDVSNLDIKAGKITMKASAQSPAEIDQIEEELGKVECFKVARGNTSIAGDERHEFSFTINSTCM